MENIDFLSKNILFHGLTQSQLKKILPIIKKITIPANTIIIEENDISDVIYLLVEGEAEVTKTDTNSRQSLHIATLTSGAIIGDIGVIDNCPRSATVRATQDSVLLSLPADQLRSISHIETEKEKDHTQKSIYVKVFENLAKNMSNNIRTTNKKIVRTLINELEHTKARIAMGNLIICTISLLCFYILILQAANSFKNELIPPALISTSVGIVIGVVTFIFIKKSHYPLTMYGLTLKNWKYVVVEAIYYTVPLLLIVILYKWILVRTVDPSLLRGFFSLSSLENNHLSYYLFFLYLLFVPLQELIVRGALQSALQELILVRYKTVWAIILSNLLFSIVHIHLSILVSLTVLIPGLFWGWLYWRQKSLLGVIVSHLIIGATAFSLGII